MKKGTKLTLDTVTDLGRALKRLESTIEIIPPGVDSAEWDAIVRSRSADYGASGGTARSAVRKAVQAAMKGGWG